MKTLIASEHRAHDGRLIRLRADGEYVQMTRLRAGYGKRGPLEGEGPDIRQFKTGTPTEHKETTEQISKHLFGPNGTLADDHALHQHIKHLTGGIAGTY